MSKKSYNEIDIEQTSEDGNSHEEIYDTEIKEVETVKSVVNRTNKTYKIPSLGAREVEAISLLDSGVSVKDVAKRFNIPTAAICKVHIT